MPSADKVVELAKVLGVTLTSFCSPKRK
ncbi:hypothetical protein QNM99_18760 [Pseudomonas sp. PCH446]